MGPPTQISACLAVRSQHEQGQTALEVETVECGIKFGERPYGPPGDAENLHSRPQAGLERGAAGSDLIDFENRALAVGQRSFLDPEAQGRELGPVGKLGDGDGHRPGRPSR